MATGQGTVDRRAASRVTSASSLSGTGEAARAGIGYAPVLVPIRALGTKGGDGVGFMFGTAKMLGRRPGQLGYVVPPLGAIVVPSGTRILVPETKTGVLVGPSGNQAEVP